MNLAEVKAPGAPLHPDDPMCHPQSEEHYLRQLKDYVAYHGVEKARQRWLSRPDLLDALE